MNIKNKVAVVTGGASGLGRATVETFVQSGCRVAIFDLNADAGNELAGNLGSQAIFCEVDVSDDDSPIQ
jgi:3-hydroxyacyl-CoA dehydrogenase/3-hydroxy-2-methylbutyryl-CoA dehydrogenase